MVSGLKYTIDLNKEPFKRVTYVALRHPDEPGFVIPDDKTKIRVLANDYIANGYDGFSMFGKDKNQKFLAGPLDVDVLKAYFQKKSPVNQSVGNRIKIIPFHTNLKSDNPGSGSVLMSPSVGTFLAKIGAVFSLQLFTLKLLPRLQ